MGAELVVYKRITCFLKCVKDSSPLLLYRFENLLPAAVEMPIAGAISKV
jgi:hypothetical protein